MNKTQLGAMRTIRALVIALALARAAAACAEPIVGARPPFGDEQFQPEPPAVGVTVYADNLDTPWSLVFLPDGRAFVSERPGRIRLIDQRGLAMPVGYVEVAGGGEAGLMGLALHPRFPAAPYLYAMHTHAAEDRTITNRVVRFVFDGQALRFDRVILGGIPGGHIHDGGRIAFGPDGNLYIGTGETGRSGLAQDMSSLGGKILRITPDGAIPPDNPFPGSPIYTLGNRNVQGLAWDPRTGQMFAAEHGPSGELGVHAWDEINVIKAGANYGWPKVVGAAGQSGLTDPLVAWPGVSVAPGGIAFWKGDLYVATLRSQALIRVHAVQQGDAWHVDGLYRWFAFDRNDGRYGRLRDVTVGPDGAMYVLTSNRDGRGRPRAGDDKILRIVNVPIGGGEMRSRSVR
jgi:glucose/arabinose dehydrogenase